MSIPITFATPNLNKWPSDEWPAKPTDIVTRLYTQRIITDTTNNVEYHIDWLQDPDPERKWVFEPRVNYDFSVEWHHCELDLRVERPTITPNAYKARARCYYMHHCKPPEIKPFNVQRVDFDFDTLALVQLVINDFLKKYE